MTLQSFDITRRQALAGIGVTTALATLPGCATTLAEGPPLAPEALLEDIAWNLLEHSPEGATSLGVDTGEHAYLRSQLADRTPAGQKALAATLRADRARAQAVDTSGLDPATRTSFEVVESAYSVALDGFALPYGDVAVGGWRNTPYVVIQNVGGYIDYPRFMASEHPVRDAADAEAYVARLAEIPGELEGELARIAAARAMGMVPPAFLLDKAIAQMESSIADAESGGTYVEGLTSRAGEIPGDWGARARPIVTGPIAAALRVQLTELKAERAVADNDAGMWSQPRGDEWYRWALRASTTTTLSPEEVHQLGLDTLGDLHGQMDPILRSIGYTTGTVGERMQALAEDPRYKFAEGDPGRAQIMRFLQERVDWIRAQMPRAFNTLVDPNMEIRRLPPAEEPGAPSAYGGAGSKDGKIPGKMWINLRTTDLHREFTLPTLVHHETIPGHVLQGEYSNDLPLIRSLLGFNAFSEGWGLYAEQIADELGAYDEHPVWRLGYLQDAAFRAARMVVDTGLHAKRWSRSKALETIVAATGESEDEMAAEIDRYCSWPGQACGYMVGKLEILRQRARAQSALGSSYDFRSFNDAVILGGNVPMDVLVKNVDRYISAARS